MRKMFINVWHKWRKVAQEESPAGESSCGAQEAARRKRGRVSCLCADHLGHNKIISAML